MSIAQITRNFIDSIENGKLFMYEDIPSDNKLGIAIELSRLFRKGVIKKVAKGKYYKPRMTLFGEMGPSSDEKIRSFLEASDNDYVTGISNFNQLGLTTQVPNIITIASNQSSRKVKMQNLTIKFVRKRCIAAQKDIKLLQLLDALNGIKKIPDVSIDNALIMLQIMIKKLEKKEQQILAILALNYPPCTKALVGAILKNLGLWEEAYKLKSTLNLITSYKINISKDVLPNKEEWRIF